MDHYDSRGRLLEEPDTEWYREQAAQIDEQITVPGLRMAEVLAGQLVYTLEQVQQYGNPDTLGVQEALILARQCRGLVRVAKDEEVMPSASPATQNETAEL